MSEARLKEALTRLGRRARPRPGWQDAVRAAIVTPRTARAARRARVAYAVAAALAGVCLLLGWFLSEKSQSEQAARAELRLKASALADYEREMKVLKTNQSEQDALLEKYRAATTEEERTRIEAEIAEKKRQAQAIQARADTARKKAGGYTTAAGEKRSGGIKVNCDPNDPLCGL